MQDSYGDGWNGAVLTINGADYSVTDTLDYMYACVDVSGCTVFSWTAGEYDGETSWSLGDLAGGAGGSIPSPLGNCVYGCSNSLAVNYNSAADINDDSCEFPAGYGCTDSLACNYDNSAEEDNGTCSYPEDGFDCEGECISGVLLTMSDSYGDGWDGAELSINGVIYSVYGDYGDSASACVDVSGCTVFSWTAGEYDGETSWSLGDLAGGAGGSIPSPLGNCVYGCSNSLAVNYNSAADINDDSCEFPAGYGCTDSLACNYDNSAEEDNGTCSYPEDGFDCEGNCKTPIFFSGSGVDTLDIFFSIHSCNGDLIFNNGYTNSEFSLCAGDLSNGYAIQMLDFTGDGWEGNYLNIGEYSYTLEDGYYQAFLATCGVMGCMDSTALNYNSDASTDDGSCDRLGCTAEWADNFDELATTDDGSCVIYDVPGCMDVSAFNYDVEATQDDGSCISVINGCMNSSMSNYNSEANTDDGSCVSWEELANALQSELNNVIPEDGVSQEDVDAAYLAGAAAIDITSDNDEVAAAAFADGVASVEVPECDEVVTQNIPLDLPQGWSMFGYTCLESLNVIEAFSVIFDKITLVKNETGAVYMPEFSFNGIGNLEFGEGYQIKMIEEVTDFQFCTTVIGR